MSSGYDRYQGLFFRDKEKEKHLGRAWYFSGTLLVLLAPRAAGCISCCRRGEGGRVPALLFLFFFFLVLLLLLSSSSSMNSRLLREEQKRRFLFWSCMLQPGWRRVRCLTPARTCGAIRGFFFQYMSLLSF